MVVEPSPPTYLSKASSRRSVMKIMQGVTTVSIASLGLAAMLVGVAAGPPKVDFSDDTVGAEPKSFASVVGLWRVEAEGETKLFAVDGRKWKEAQPAAGVADKARAL